MKSMTQNRNNEGGIVLLWLLFSIMALMVVGLTFLLYAEANLKKFKAQFISMNLVAAGTFSSEFSTDESLNTMAMVANMSGFNGAVAAHGYQTFDKANLQLEHEPDPGDTQGVKAYVSIRQGAISNLVNGIADVSTSAFSLSRPRPLYLHLAFDYSASLIGGGIEDLLEGFEVIKGDGSIGPNGVLGPSGIEPNKIIQTAMPFAWDESLRIIRPWSGRTTAWPVTTLDTTGCNSTSETLCSQYATRILDHRTVIEKRASDLFMSYKKASVVLAGVVGRITPYLDVSVFGGVMTDDFSTLLANSISSTLPGFQNNGVYPVHLYDEASYDQYKINAQGKITAKLVKQHSIENPKDIMHQGISMAPDRVLQHFADLTFSRKFLAYGTLTDMLGNDQLISRYRKFLDPPLPVSNPELELDGFTYSPGALKDGKYPSITSDPYYPFGWPGRPNLLDQDGDSHPINADLPPEIRYPLEYNCQTGPPVNMNALLSSIQAGVGKPLCLIYNQCGFEPAQNCSAVVGISEQYAYYNSSVPTSPSCTDYGPYVPRCKKGGNVIDDLHAVVCVNGVPRCFPDVSLFPRCVTLTGDITLNIPKCCNWEDGDCSGVEYNPGANPPVPTGHGLPNFKPPSTPHPTATPIQRGLVTFPETSPNNRYATAFHLLNDLSPLYGGTYTQNVIPNQRCDDFKQELGGEQPECAVVIVTDNRPLGIDAAGNQVITDEDIFNQLETNVNAFTNNQGKMFTWFLGHRDSQYEEMSTIIEIEISAGTINPSVLAIYTHYVTSELPIPLADCASWDANKPVGVPECLEYNDSVLPEYLADRTMMDDFKGLMDSPDDGRIYVETELKNTIEGPDLVESFLNGLSHLLAKLKQSVRFQK
ncbi:MAG: hypothetical protein H6619_01490 [Deltaproteobacteria bacterium]|nr:hypothetical protein [Deltaproteobacteria bacterium]